MCRSRRRWSYHPGLPKEEQFELVEALDNTENAPILIQLVAPVSADTIPNDLRKCKRVCLLCIFYGGNRTGSTFPQKRKKVSGKCKSRIKDPCHDGIGIRTAEDVAGLKDTIDGCIVGTHFIELMEEK